METNFLISLPDVNFFAQAADKQGNDILGSGGCLYIRLKTLRGAINRVKKAVWPDKTSHITIYDRCGQARSTV